MTVARTLLVCATVALATIACNTDLEPATPITIGADERPNVLLIVIDDLGFTDLGSYGSEIRTPRIDRLASDGLRFSNYYVSPNCGPTRSMLLSGMDHHLSGNGTMLEHIGENQRGLPGYEGHLNHRVAALPEVLQDNGYNTYMAGKWHLGATQESSPAARGFDRSFALLLGGGSHFADRKGLVSKAADAPYRKDGELVEELGDDFYSTTFYTDQIIDYIKLDRSEERAPFFAYLAYTAVHWPLQAPDEALNLYRGTYDAGYDVLREARFNGAIEAGVVPRGIAPSPPTASTRAWSELDDEEKRRQARKMEIYSAMLELVDRNVGRLLDFLAEVDELDNTLIIVMSDNGAEGNRRRNMGGDGWVERTFDDSYAAMGHQGSYVYTGPGWAQASSAPFMLYKAHTAEGGIRAPLIISGPSVDHSGSVTQALTTVRDIMPTILEATETSTPGDRFRDRDVLPMTGSSMLELLDGNASEVHTEDEIFGWEIFGGRAIRQGDWKLLWIAGPNGDDKWKLYNISRDPGETTDLSTEEPATVEHMLGLWTRYAEQNNIVLPNSLHGAPWGR